MAAATAVRRPGNVREHAPIDGVEVLGVFRAYSGLGFLAAPDAPAVVVPHDHVPRRWRSKADARAVPASAGDGAVVAGRELLQNPDAVWVQEHGAATPFQIEGLSQHDIWRNDAYRLSVAICFRLKESGRDVSERDIRVFDSASATSPLAARDALTRHDRAAPYFFTVTAYHVRVHGLPGREGAQDVDVYPLLQKAGLPRIVHMLGEAVLKVFRDELQGVNISRLRVYPPSEQRGKHAYGGLSPAGDDCGRLQPTSPQEPYHVVVS